MAISLHNRVKAFCSLGTAIGQVLQGNSLVETAKLQELIESYHLTNPWFTPENVRQSLAAWEQLLCKDKLTKWLSVYRKEELEKPPATLLTIMAGNIPMVGFHDAVAVLLSGNRLLTKLSSKDPFLIRELLTILCQIEPAFRKMIYYTENDTQNHPFNAVLATGSDNSARHFHYLYGNYPLLIRNNRTSAAILSGDESDDELYSLGSDIFSYFGLGCRSITQLWLPPNYNVTGLGSALSDYKDTIHHPQYKQNYLYNRALMKLNRQDFIDTGFFLLRQSNSLFSPVGVINYAFINRYEQTQTILENSAKIQAIAGKNHIPFGKCQQPELWDYSDNIDTISFIIKIKNGH